MRKYVKFTNLIEGCILKFQDSLNLLPMFNVCFCHVK